MDNIITGINESDLESLSMDILDYADRLSEILEKIDLKVSLLKDYFKGSPYQSFLISYSEFKKNYPIVKGNVVSYSDELITLIQKVRENDKYLATLFLSSEKDTKSKTKTVKSL